jgi:hypothetical protein
VDATEITVSFGLVSGVRGVHILDEEVAGELGHVFAVAFMRRRKKTRPPPVTWYVGSLLGCGLGQFWARQLGCWWAVAAR